MNHLFFRQCLSFIWAVTYKDTFYFLSKITRAIVILKIHVMMNVLKQSYTLIHDSSHVGATLIMI